GFAERADQLLAEAMSRRSRDARGHAEMAAADRVLRRLPGQSALADRLEADYWLRRAASAVHAERRSEAVLLALEALPAGGADARHLLAELIGDDLPRLRKTFRLGGTPSAWAVDWEAGSLSVVDEGQRAARLAIDPDGGHAVAQPAPVRLASFQHVPVRREIGVDEHGAAGAFRLSTRI